MIASIQELVNKHRIPACNCSMTGEYIKLSIGKRYDERHLTRKLDKDGRRMAPMLVLTFCASGHLAVVNANRYYTVVANEFLCDLRELPAMEEHLNTLDSLIADLLL